LESDDALDDWLLENVRTSHLISGTCKMGPESDPTAVVDQFGRVHGLDGLRVADASIMPDCIRANTNVTSMVIGERVANFVKNG
jgi:choline dehydrogenase